ncbi:MAG: hypothetical protein L0211_14200 [Planctomycetaceae bacterium]|nr:hypothetical protein [Planctomycetaceae bacterium]
MKNAFLTLALTSAMLVGGMAWTDSAEARPRRGYYGGYYGSYYPRYYSGYYPRYYSGYYPRYYGGYYPRYYSYPYRYSYGYPGVYLRVPGAGFYFRF